MKHLHSIYKGDGVEFSSLFVESYVEGAATRLAEFAAIHKISVSEMALMGYQIFSEAYMRRLMDSKSSRKKVRRGHE